MSLHIFQATDWSRKLLWRVAASRARSCVQQIAPSLPPPGAKLLDIGAGICDITLTLVNLGYRVTPLDVEDYSCTPLLRPVLYDGRTMPFKDKAFDTALLLTVLHHTPEPEVVLREAQRVAQRIIIIEDVYSSQLHKYLTCFMDSLLNLEFWHHPHSNKTDKEWRQLFKEFGLKLITVKASKSFGVFRHRLYVLEASS